MKSAHCDQDEALQTRNHLKSSSIFGIFGSRPLNTLSCHQTWNSVWCVFYFGVPFLKIQEDIRGEEAALDQPCYPLPSNDHQRVLTKECSSTNLT